MEIQQNQKYLEKYYFMKNLITFCLKYWDYISPLRKKSAGIILKVQSCKMCNNKYIIVSTKIINNETGFYVIEL